MSEVNIKGAILQAVLQAGYDNAIKELSSKTISQGIIPDYFAEIPHLVDRAKKYTDSEFKQLVAVYGTLKRGKSNHELLEDATFLGEQMISGFTMYTNGAYPAVVPGNGEIKVEVYSINQSIRRQLDILEGFTGRRGSPQNHYDIMEIRTQYGKAWLYIYSRRPEGWAIIENGEF